jgi:putative two-component system response regulator
MPDPSRRSGGAVLVVEDDAEVRSLLTDAPPDLVLTDVNMGAMSGVELCARLKADPRFALTPVVILTAVHDLEARVAGLAAGADDFFAKPFELLELRTRLSALLRVKTLLDLLERAQSVITALGATIEARDVYTRGAVPDGVLLKNGPLTPAERQQINLHPGVGADLVRGMHTLDEVRPIIRHHHERWDGSGYPDGLRGEAIPLGARVMAVVDVYDALRTARPYKPPLSLAETLDILKAETDAGAWDPRIVVCLPDVLRELGVTDEPDARMPGGISHGA